MQTLKYNISILYLIFIYGNWIIVIKYHQTEIFLNEGKAESIHFFNLFLSIYNHSIMIRYDVVVIIFEYYLFINTSSHIKIIEFKILRHK